MHSGTSFRTRKSLSTVMYALSHLEGYRVKYHDDDHAIIHVGSLWKYMLFGVYITDNYLPPISVVVTKSTASEDTESVVTIISRATEIMTTRKNELFIQHGFDTIREILK